MPAERHFSGPSTGRYLQTTAESLGRCCGSFSFPCLPTSGWHNCGLWKTKVSFIPSPREVREATHLRKVGRGWDFKCLYNEATKRWPAEETGNDYPNTWFSPSKPPWEETFWVAAHTGIHGPAARTSLRRLLDSQKPPDQHQHFDKISRNSAPISVETDRLGWRGGSHPVAQPYSWETFWRLRSLVSLQGLHVICEPSLFMGPEGLGFSVP